MGSLKVNQVMYRYDDDGSILEAYSKPAYVEIDKISSFYIEEPEVINGVELKPYFIGVDGVYYSVMPDLHVYEVVYEKLIKNAIKG